jgi:hypothetical protein
MKRALLATLAVVSLATPLFAITGKPASRHALRVGVLRTSDGWQNADLNAAAVAIERELAEQLRSSGVDAFDTHRTLDEARDEEIAGADILVEVSGGAARSRDIGGIDVADRHLTATLGLVISKVAAEVRVYDARSLELLDRFDLTSTRAAVLPTYIGIRNADLFAWATVPFVRHLQYRSAIRSVAEDAAQRIAQR